MHPVPHQTETHQKMAATVDPAFEGAGQAPGVELWRIEQMKPVKTSIEGKLHTG